MKTLAASLSILTQQGVMLYLLRGVAFTCIISVLGVISGPHRGLSAGAGPHPASMARPASWAG